MPVTRRDSADERATADFAAGLRWARVPARVAYVGILALATLTSLRLDLDAGAVLQRLSRMFNPSVAPRDIVDGARNLALFAGWGLVWMVTSPPGRPWTAFRNAVLSGAVLSMTVEGLQVLSDTRMASVLDLATNTGGSLLGALASALIVLGLSRRSGARSFVGMPASIFAIAYGAAVLGEASVPLFRQEFAFYASGGPFERLGRAIQNFSWDTLTSLPTGDFLLFLPVGVFVVAALYELGLSYRKAATAGGLGTAFLLVALEVAHGVLGIPIDAGAALVHVVAVAAGATLAVFGLPKFTRSFRGSARPRALTASYAVVLALWALRPYRPETSLDALVGKLESDWWIPLQSLGARVDMFSVVDVVAPFLLYAPLGALLAVWPLRGRGPLSGFAPALYLAVATEVSQTLVATRTFDVTDLMIQSAGVAVGWVLVRRAGYLPYGEQLLR